MLRTSLTRLRRFRDNEDGNSVIPFAIWLPVFVVLIVGSIELGTLTFRYTMLESAMDRTVRDIRLGIGPQTHADMKASVCEKASILPDCENTLRLEMVQLDMRDYSAPPSDVKCVDVAEPVVPELDFSVGNGGQMMFLRACYMFKPVTGVVSFNAMLDTDDNGYSGMVATSAFVNEPS